MKIMISCGEASGDLYAGALVGELLARDPSIRVFGFGGDRMRRAGADLIATFDGLTVTGLTEALRVLPRSYATLNRLVAAAQRERPDVFVAIDFPDFNFRLMARLHQLGIPVVYYVSPQLWAWRAGRMATMQRCVDKVLVIFGFEEALYQRAGVPVEFVGHPLVDLAQPGQSRAEFLHAQGLRPDAPTVALLPGSRPNEVHRIGPVMAAAVPLIREKVPNVQFVVARAPNLSDALFEPFVAAPPEGGPYETPVIVTGRTDDVLASSDIVVTASGTATVQAALHERPMVVVYRLSPLTYRLGKPFVTVTRYAMPNLVAGESVVPELIQDDFTPQSTAREATRLLIDPAHHGRARAALRRVRERLGAPGASGRAAAAILEVAARGATPA